MPRHVYWGVYDPSRVLWLRRLAQGGSAWYRHWRYAEKFESQADASRVSDTMHHTVPRALPVDENDPQKAEKED